MSVKKSPIDHMLNLALASAANHYQYYHNAAMNVETTDVKALLLVLANTEAELIDRIRDMMATGIVEEIQEVAEIDDLQDLPDGTPFDLMRNDSDPRIFVCNKALAQEIKGYTYYLSIAARAKSKVVSRLFQYFAFVKKQQIENIRRVCETF
ncbi:MAG: hypothetical protein ACW97A_10020 [Candidatus Thorarchaeota archaeon]|jgi:rubrerythrin